MPWGQLKDDFGNTSGHIWNNLRTSWGQLGTTWDLVAGDYMGITCRISWRQLGDEYGTSSGHIGDN